MATSNYATALTLAACVTLAISSHSYADQNDEEEPAAILLTAPTNETHQPKSQSLSKLDQTTQPHSDKLASPQSDTLSDSDSTTDKTLTSFVNPTTPLATPPETSPTTPLATSPITSTPQYASKPQATSTDSATTEYSQLIPESENQLLSRRGINSTNNDNATSTNSTDTNNGNATGTDINNGTQSSDQSHWVIETITALGIVIILIYLVRVILRKITGQGATISRGAGGLVELLARTPIAPRTHILFLKINQSIVVVGQTPAGLNTLMTIQSSEDVARMLTQISAAKQGSVTQGFKSLMNQLDRTYQGDKDTIDDGSDTQEQYIDRTRHQLTSLLTRIRNIKSRGK